MKRTPILLVSVLALALLLVLFVFRGDDDTTSQTTPTPTVSASPTSTVTPSPQTQAPTPTPQAFTIRLAGSGVNPKSLTIRVGDSVTFLNETTTPWWPASDVHPVHNVCPGFDARRVLQQNETYTLTFTEVRTCTFHNHIDAGNTSQQGVITVRQ